MSLGFRLLPLAFWISLITHLDLFGISDFGFSLIGGFPAFGLGCSSTAFVLDHLAFHSARFGPVLPTDFFPGLAGGERLRSGAGFDDVTEAFQSALAVQALGTFLLAPHLDPRRSVHQPDGRGGFVDLLASRSGSPDEGLVDLIQGNAEPEQPYFE
jgi:hypothetical protein